MKWVCAVAAVVVAGCQGEGPPEPVGGMPVRIEAAADAAYTFKCRFRAVEVRGQGLTNSLELSGSGPREGSVPTDNALCTLTQTGGTGPVVATITSANDEATASVAGPGATANLDVFAP